MRTRTFTVLFSVMLFAASLFVLPIILNTGTGTSFCEIGGVNAQDNPCLAQDATISAMQVQLQQVQFQATLDAINMQSTLEAVSGGASVSAEAYVPTIEYLESELATARADVGSGSAAPGVSGVSFTERFDSNDLGWNLLPQQVGAASISQGRLLVSANPGSFYAVEIPGANAESIYIESEMISYYQAGTDDERSQYIGIAIGDLESGRMHLLLAGYETHRRSGMRPTVNDMRWSIRLYEVNGETRTLLFDRPRTMPLWQDGEPVSFGFEARNGFYTLFIGSDSESTQLVTFGNQIGFAVDGAIVDPNYDAAGGAAASFDNLIVRSSR